MYIPKYFIRELKNIDPAMYVVKDCELGAYDIWKEVEVEVPTKSKPFLYKEHRMVASFDRLNDAALADLRYRKWLGNRFETAKDPRKYWKWMKDQEKAIKAKKIETARDMQARGWMGIYNRGRKKLYT